ncbi:cytochrome P450 4AB6 isoform X1 [Nasonia vitripennis]|uniref:Cytochrome P450 n=1 Tax=Nasonia vitripennis TaxID=7425 RepID=A0A7M7ITQ3_NASVI|nr:cytochrome P450 4AB6 [Nasonia vitripennis]XP_016841077.1 cytochrome P450 4AB6 isoform X1 [Nasonia vitripennis]XP_016841105.1 cytochrome P450 4AB6 isoform X1 [Nasonia vitripennis]
MLIETIVVICMLLYAFHHYTRNDRIGRYVNKIPGPPTWPIVGNLPALSAPHEQLWPLGIKWDKQYYPIYKIWTTHKAVIVILHPDDVETLLTSMEHIEKSIMYDMVHPWFGTGLLTSTGAKWQKRRKILTPAFHFHVLQKYFDIIVENNEKVMHSLKSNGSVINNLVELLTYYTLDVICETAMGTTLLDKEHQQKYRNVLHDVSNAVIYRLMRPWFQVDWTFRWTSVAEKQKKALEVIHGFSKKIIKERKEYHEKTKGHYLNQLESDQSDDKKEDEEYFGYRKKRLAMLDLLIAKQKDGNQIDDAGIREEVDTFIFEGHDTSAMAMCFAILLIAEHNDVQDRIRAEVKEVLEKSEGKMGVPEIQQLNYLELCIKESLRLYPSVPFISRGVTKDLHLKNYIVPKGTLIQINIFSLHRDPNFWPDPEKFDPDRFLPDRFQGRHPYSYIPFSAGPRNCIGQKFAMMELKAFIAHLISEFYLEPIDLAHEVLITPDLVLRPARPVKVKIVPVNK